MRKDMAHVLKVRPSRAADCSSLNYHTLQHRTKNPYRAAKAFTLDDQGDVCDLFSSNKMPMRHPNQGYNRKGFSVKVGVLIRYLNRHLNEPWDQVFGDISKTLGHTNGLWQWLLLDILVLVGLSEVDQPYPTFNLRPGQFYVTSSDGVLKRWLAESKE